MAVVLRSVVFWSSWRLLGALSWRRGTVEGGVAVSDRELGRCEESGGNVGRLGRSRSLGEPGDHQQYQHHQVYLNLPLTPPPNHNTRPSSGVLGLWLCTSHRNSNLLHHYQPTQ